MVSTKRRTEPEPGREASTVVQALEHERLTAKVRRVEGVVAALQARRCDREPNGAVPLPLDQALEDFTRQLAALRARAQALLAGRDPVPPPGVA